MNAITQDGLQKIQEISNRYGLNTNATLNMLQAVVNGGGTMAQFNIPELGGGGQWMQGGMTMVGDMFNYSLKNTVNNLCSELSNLLYSQNIFLPPVYEPGQPFQNGGNWWPSELGHPSSSGSQNNFKYAYFPDPVRRLAILDNGRLRVYDTLNHHISGVSQQQGSNDRFSVSSQFGWVDIYNLPLVSDSANGNSQNVPAQVNDQTNGSFYAASSVQEEDVFAAIEKLAGLKEKGYITEVEFQSKKTDLLNRL